MVFTSDCFDKEKDRHRDGPGVDFGFFNVPQYDHIATKQITDTVLTNNSIVAYKTGNVATLTQISSSGISSTGITLPASLKPKNGNITFIGKANYNGDKWNQGFIIDINGNLTARAADNNSAISVTWTSWSVTYITI